MAFFGILSLKLDIVEDTHIPTMATNGRKLYYNPEFVSSLSSAELEGVIAHEVMHCVMLHMTRKQNRHHIKWNYACDYAINPIVKDSGFTLPGDCLFDKKYHEMSAEKIYEILPEQASLNVSLNGTKGGSYDGHHKSQVGSVKDPDQGQSEGDGDNQLGGSSNKSLEKEWKTATAQAAQQCKACGNLPGCIQEMINDILNPKIDWRAQLRSFVENTARNDYMMLPPNKRFIQQGLYLPSLRSEELQPIVIAVDTSGSISTEDLKQFSGEINCILEDYHTEVHVIYCDASVNKVVTFDSNNLPFYIERVGGGGTDFKPPFQYVEDNQLTPSCLIYLTDLECNSYPSPEPPYPTLWAYLNGYRKNKLAKELQPPFGDVVLVED